MLSALTHGAKTHRTCRMPAPLPPPPPARGVLVKTSYPSSARGSYLLYIYSATCKLDTSIVSIWLWQQSRVFFFPSSDFSDSEPSLKGFEDSQFICLLYRQSWWEKREKTNLFIYARLACLLLQSIQCLPWLTLTGFLSSDRMIWT